MIGLDGRRRLERREAGEAIDDGLHRRAVAQEAERERGAHPDGRVRVGEERDDERGRTEVADTGRPKRGDAPDEESGATMPRAKRSGLKSRASSAAMRGASCSTIASSCAAARRRLCDESHHRGTENTE